MTPDFGHPGAGEGETTGDTPQDGCPIRNE